MRLIPVLYIILFLQAQFLVATSRSISFVKANTSIGLSDNLVFEATRDKNGLIWIATANGLNTFNGYEVKTWHHLTDQIFSTRDIRGVYCDEKNRIWLIDANGSAGMLDEFRKPSAIHFANAADSGRVRFLFPASNNDMFMLVGNRLLKYDKLKSNFSTIAQLPDSAVKNNFLQEANIGNDRYLLPGNDRLVCLDLRAAKLTGYWNVKNILGAVALPDGNILATTTSNSDLVKIDWHTGKTLKNYGTLKDQFGKSVSSYLRYMAVQADGRIVMSSGYAGIYLFDPSNETLTNFAHDPLDSKSISGNNTFKVSADKNGYVFVTTRSSGLNIYNCYITRAVTKTFFRDRAGDRIFDGFVGPTQQDKQGNIWLGTQGGLIEWNMEQNNVRFHEYGVVNGESLAGREEVRMLWFDKQDRLWVGLNRYGVLLLDKSGKPIRYYGTRFNDPRQKLPGNFILDIIEGPDKNVWVSTNSGLGIIDVNSLNVIPLENYPSLSELARINCFSSWVKSANEIWIASSRGAYQYLLNEGRLTLYDSAKGLTNKGLQCIKGDMYGNVYAGGNSGLEKIKPDGTIEFLGITAHGISPACLSLEQDASGNLWMGSDNYVLCYQPALNKWHVFDESYGFTAQGFRYHASFLSAEGNIFFGGNQGISWFAPKDLLKVQLPVAVLVSSMSAGDSTQYYTTSIKRDLAFEDNSVSFQLTTMALYGNRELKLQYKLDGFDTSWMPVEIGKQVDYPQLPPGSYNFKARYSLNGMDWQPAANEVGISIATLWWKKPWFKLLLLSLLAVAIYYVIQSWLTRKKLQKEEEETEKAVLYLTSSMQSHHSIDDMLWDVCRNCISRLKFEDSVIYLIDKREKVLHQKAAWGPKTSMNNRIIDPIELPVGKGIAGAVAETGKAEIIHDTTTDNRYVVDDRKRYSEICVPIIADGEVIGVIDSEHSKKGFFQHRHLKILTTLASLLGSKIASARAEDQKRQAEMALLEIRQRTTEIEMHALRAQMNPHFLFNSLNSINNFILKNDADNASAYLTRFARLMRLILDNSREDWITLDNEIKALQLYIEMESLRFDNAFEYQIQVGDAVTPMSVLIPPMIIQPYVENAIWHGLMHRKEKGSRLEICIEKKNEYLEVRIKDNGVGREVAQQLKSKFGLHKKSHGMQITHERLRMVNAVYEVDARTEVQDLTLDDGTASGTCVILTMKYKQHESNHN